MGGAEGARAHARGEPEAGGLLADLPPGHDPLQRAHRIQERVARVGFDWPSCARRLGEGTRGGGGGGRGAGRRGTPAALEEEVGDLLFSVVNLARLAGVHAPTALARANAKFVRRFSALERLAAGARRGARRAELAALDRLWDEAKRGEG